ncbi:MAG TPA: CocE/NonD family hydrolase [Flavobacteriales bacterium]|nr:CocE/NonD family hydrolase [Flavobacteriales bacterium]
MKKLFLLCFVLSRLQGLAQLTPIYDSIPMSDGKKLAMTRFQPSGCTQCPTILIQTPYNRLLYNAGLPLGVGTDINSQNYNFVIVDWRGFYGSASALYSGAPARGEDGYDAVEWIAQQAWSDTVVGTWGPSALGRCQFMTAKENPPHLKCMVPQVAGPQYSYAEYYPGGVARTEYFEQLDGLGFGMSPVLLSNPVYNGVWAFTEAANFYPDSIRVPTFMQGGWYDHNIEVMLEFFNAIRATGTGVEDQHRLLMGPWVHGGHGTAYVGSVTQGELSYPAGAGWSDSLAMLFFDHHMRSIANGWDTTQFITYFQMGEDAWKTSAVWPPVGMTNTNLYFHGGGVLHSVAPTVPSISENIIYDPNDPSPAIGGPLLRIDLDQGPYDQGPLVESRADILKYESIVLGQDVVMKGKAQVHLKISSDRKDTDFAIRLTDVYPDGRSMLVNTGIFRMRFRDGFTAADTSAMIPGTIYGCVVDLPSPCLTFKAGHRIRVDVTSGIYPQYNRNCNTGASNMYPGLNADSLVNPLVATNTIYMNSSNQSYIALPLVDYVGAVHENVHLYGAAVFPNPAGDEVQLEIKTEENEKIEVVLTGVTGKQLFTETKNLVAGLNRFTFKTSGFAPGLYCLTLYGKNGQQSLKLIIN